MAYDLIIIGGGPAGITAGIYAARQKVNVLLITKAFGGQMAKKTVMIENYPGFPKISGLDLIKKFEEHIKSVDVKIENDEVEKIEKGFTVLTKSGKKFESKTVIIASGAEPRTLNIPSEKEFIGRGISYCPMCDGPMFRDKTVAVIGGGDAGFESAIFLAHYVKKIYILEYSSKLKASMDNQDIAGKSGKVEVIMEAELKEVKGDKFVKSLVYKDLKTGEEKELKVDGIFVEIGYRPEASFVKDLVDLNENGEIIVDQNTAETKTPGLYAAGDVDGGKCKQIIVAAGEGAIAANSAYKYLQNIQ